MLSPDTILPDVDQMCDALFTVPTLIITQPKYPTKRIEDDREDVVGSPANDGSLVVTAGGVSGLVLANWLNLVDGGSGEVGNDDNVFGSEATVFGGGTGVVSSGTLDVGDLRRGWFIRLPRYNDLSTGFGTGAFNGSFDIYVTDLWRPGVESRLEELAVRDGSVASGVTGPGDEGVFTVIN